MEKNKDEGQFGAPICAQSPKPRELSRFGKSFSQTGSDCLFGVVSGFRLWALGFGLWGLPNRTKAPAPARSPKAMKPARKLAGFGAS